MSKIVDIVAREVLDSRGNPTIQVEVCTKKGIWGSAMVPSGASTGTLEALELRDGNLKHIDKELKNAWYGGKGVTTAVNNVVQKIAPKIIGLEVDQQRLIDQTMIKLDQTENKANLGANAILGVSLAVLKAAAREHKMPLYRYIGGTNAKRLPMPLLNLINGGAHATNTIDFQEFMIVPIGAKTFKQALQMANHIFHNLANLLKTFNHGTQVGDEGGFAPNLQSHEEALDFLVAAIKKSGYKPATKGENAVAIALDCAASEFYELETKLYKFKKLAKILKTSNAKIKTSFTTNEMIAYLAKLVKKYPIISIEDGLAETDWQGFVELTKKIGHKVQIVGDDLYSTNKKLLQKGIDLKASNAILIKLNQIGSVTETLETIELAHNNGFKTIISHRSGETEDTTIADLAVAINSGQIKTGSLSRTDRIAKYNRLLKIVDILGGLAEFGNQIKPNKNLNK